MTIEDVIKKSILPLAFMVFWFWMTKTIMKVSGQTDWFWWIFIAGLPFGIHKMRLILIPRGMDTTATLGMATLSVIIGALIGCIMISGLCDMFDGKIARTKKNRTEDEKQFGIQIDSLCDVVCFGVFPIVLCYELGMRRIYSMAILVLYGLAGVIRLGYFNVMETKRQQETSENRKYYQGLPITSMSVVLPLLFVVSLILPGYHWFLYALHITVAVVGILFVADFKFRKPTNKELAVLVGIVGVAVLFILFYNGGWWEFCRARFFRHM